MYLKQRSKQSTFVFIYKDLKGKASIPKDDLCHQDRLSRICTHGLSEHAMRALTFPSSFLYQELLEIGISSLCLFYPLLDMLRNASLDIPIWLGLGTDHLSRGSWWRFVDRKCHHKSLQIWPQICVFFPGNKFGLHI